VIAPAWLVRAASRARGRGARRWVSATRTCPGSTSRRCAPSAAASTGRSLVPPGWPPGALRLRLVLHRLLSRLPQGLGHRGQAGRGRPRAHGPGRPRHRPRARGTPRGPAEEPQWFSAFGRVIGGPWLLALGAASLLPGLLRGGAPAGPPSVSGSCRPSWPPSCCGVTRCRRCGCCSSRTSSCPGAARGGRCSSPSGRPLPAGARRCRLGRGVVSGVWPAPWRSWSRPSPLPSRSSASERRTEGRVRKTGGRKRR